MSKEQNELLINNPKSNNSEVMSNKHIEEMAKIACVGSREGDCENCKSVGICSSYTISEKLYNAGYRKQEWISVEERLPKEDGCYITYTNANGKSNGVIAQSLVTKTIRGQTVRRWEWQTRISPWKVTHWMPLPEAPKMKGGAE